MSFADMLRNILILQFLVQTRIIFHSYPQPWYHIDTVYLVVGVPWWLSVKESVCQCKKHGFDPWSGKIPWRRKWQPTPVFLPGKSHGGGAWGVIVHGVTKSQTQLSH